MTKGELIKLLQENLLSDDTVVLLSGKIEDDCIWYDIKFVDPTEAGEPILIGIGEAVML